MLVNVCMITVNIFNRKCLNHVGTDYYRKFVSFPTCAEYIFIFVFFFYLVHHRGLPVHEKDLVLCLLLDVTMQKF